MWRKPPIWVLALVTAYAVTALVPCGMGSVEAGHGSHAAEEMHVSSHASAGHGPHHATGATLDTPCECGCESGQAGTTRAKRLGPALPSARHAALPASTHPPRPASEPVDLAGFEAPPDSVPIAS